MDSLRLFVGQTFAGFLERDAHGVSFRYIDGYAGPPIFLNWPVSLEVKRWPGLPPELTCLLPDGAQRVQWNQAEVSDHSDFGLLAASGLDLPGFISALPDDEKRAPIGREADPQTRLGRARIQPEVDALPYDSAFISKFNAQSGFRFSMASRRAIAGAIYSRKNSSFQLVEAHSSYRLTLEPADRPGWVDDQLLTSQLAQDAGLAVVSVDTVRTTDGVPVLWAERFDRTGASNRQRVRVESACQLLGRSPADKCDASLEAVAELISQYCTNPRIQLMRLFHRTLFGWLTGNRGLHLKHWSLLQNGSIVELSPAYGLMNHSLWEQERIESALSIGGQCEGFDRTSLIEKLGKEVCGLNARIIGRVMKQLESVNWEQRILESGLSKDQQRIYFEGLSERWRRLR
jgi:HipA-like protein